MKKPTEFHLKILKLLFFFYCGPLGYWFLVSVPLDLVMRYKINEIVSFSLLLIPMAVTFFVFLAKLSYFSKRFEHTIFLLNVGSALLLFMASFLYTTSIFGLVLVIGLICIITTITTPYLFAKILNLVSFKTKIRFITELYLIWFGGGVFYLIVFITFGFPITFFISGISVVIGTIIQFLYVIKPKKYVPIQLLPFNYKSIANGNVLGVFVVLTLFWSVGVIIIKEFSNRQLILLNYQQLSRYEILWLFLVINSIVGIFFYILNRRLNLQLLYYLDYIFVSISVIIALFWKPLLPLAFLFVSSFGIVTFAFSMPDLMDINRGLIGPSFMAFFQILLLAFPMVHVLILLLDTSLSDSIASFLLIIIIIAMALISGIKFLPVPVRVEYLIISHKDGIPLYSTGKASKDEKIISGLLTGILAILNTSSSDKIKTIDHGDKKIMISISDRIFGVAVCDRYSKSVAYHLQEIVDLFEAGFDKILDLNSYNVQLFKKQPPLLVKKIDLFMNK